MEPILIQNYVFFYLSFPTQLTLCGRQRSPLTDLQSVAGLANRYIYLCLPSSWHVCPSRARAPSSSCLFYLRSCVRLCVRTARCSTRSPSASRTWSSSSWRERAGRTRRRRPRRSSFSGRPPTTSGALSPARQHIFFAFLLQQHWLQFWSDDL